MRLRKRKLQKEKLTRNSESTSETNKVKREQKDIFRQILDNPNLSYQLLVVALTFLNGPVKLERRMDNMTSAVNTLRSMTEVLNTTMSALKTASDAPRQIRRLLE